MPNAGNVVGGIGTGAVEGFTVAGPVGGVIGGVLGGAASLFGDSPEEQRQKRFNAYLAALHAARSQAQGMAYRRSAGLIGDARQSAAARAAAMGRASDTERFVLPAEDQAARTGNQNIDNVNQFYNQAELQAHGDFADRPIEPSVSNYLENFGGQLASAVQGNKYLDIIKNQAPQSSQLGYEYGYNPYVNARRFARTQPLP